MLLLFSGRSISLSVLAAASHIAKFLHTHTTRAWKCVVYLAKYPKEICIVRAVVTRKPSRNVVFADFGSNGKVSHTKLSKKKYS